MICLVRLQLPFSFGNSEMVVVVNVAGWEFPSTESFISSISATGASTGCCLDRPNTSLIVGSSDMVVV